MKDEYKFIEHLKSHGVESVILCVLKVFVDDYEANIGMFV